MRVCLACSVASRSTSTSTYEFDFTPQLSLTHLSVKQTSDITRATMDELGNEWHVVEEDPDFSTTKLTLQFDQLDLKPTVEDGQEVNKSVSKCQD